MTPKVPITGTPWKQSLNEAVQLLRSRRSFFFCGFLDADALGTMLSLALYLRQLEREVHILLPHSPQGNLDFLEDIIHHNHIHTVNHRDEIVALKDEVDTVIFCDTANPQLVSQFPAIQECFLDQQIPTIEIDHHFGNDSVALSEYGVRLFREANASSEIAAELMQEFHHHYPEFPNPFVERNILLCLLIGMVTDTVGGQITPVKKDYAYWLTLLGDNLKSGTYTNDGRPPLPLGQKNISSPEDLLNHLHQLTEEQTNWINTLEARIVLNRGVGYLSLLDATLQDLHKDFIFEDWPGYIPVREYLLNRVPQKAGKAGILFYQGTGPDGGLCLYLKIRRAVDYSHWDLREAESMVQSVFGEKNYLGGGGHPGAVSFRIRLMEPSIFLEGVRRLMSELILQLP